jgi:tRNA modification GTPase
LAKRDVAIVSPFAGTTRDIVEVSLNLGGYQVVLSDTAGIRDTTCEIEAIGVKKVGLLISLSLSLFNIMY